MKKNKHIQMVVALMLILALIGYFYLHKNNIEILKVRGQEIQIEIADTLQEREIGLMYREYLAPNKGMLFIFPIETAATFWMKNTLIPLDMIFISEDKTINHIEKDVPPCPPEKA